MGLVNSIRIYAANGTLAVIQRPLGDLDDYENPRAGLLVGGFGLDRFANAYYDPLQADPDEQALLILLDGQLQVSDGLSDNPVRLGRAVPRWSPGQ